jgi:hypothetical protein
VHGVTAQPRVDRPGGPLAVADAHRDGPLARDGVAPGEDARHPGHQGVLGHLHGVSLELQARDAPEEAGVTGLAEREDHGVGLQGLEPPGAVGAAVLVELLDLDGEVGVPHRADGAQPVDPDALLLGVLRLGLVGGHLVAGAAVDDHGVVGSEPAGDAGGIHRGVSAAVHRDAPGEGGLRARRGTAEELDGIHDAGGVLVGDVDAGGQVGTDGDEDGVEGPVAHLGLEVLDPVALLDDDPEVAQPVDLGVEHGARQAVGRDAVAHHPARLAPDVAHRHRVPEAHEVVGRGQPARAAADDEDAVAGGRRWRVEGPAVLDGLVAEEPLDPVDGHGAVEIGTVARGFAGVVADPPVDGGEGVVERQPAPGGLGVAALDQGQPRLDVLARGTARVARRQEVDVDGPLRADGPRPGPALTHRRERGEVAIFSGHGHLLLVPPREDRTTAILRRVVDECRTEETSATRGPG